MEQLNLGGKMVIPVGEGDVQEMRVIEKVGPEELKTTVHGTYRFVPMLKDRNAGSLV
jgi:protein-L-isoaspartate(D-aspartate) O-methyltransferase